MRSRNPQPCCEPQHLGVLCESSRHFGSWSRGIPGSGASDYHHTARNDGVCDLGRDVRGDQIGDDPVPLIVKIRDSPFTVFDLQVVALLTIGLRSALLNLAPPFWAARRHHFEPPSTAGSWPTDLPTESRSCSARPSCGRPIPPAGLPNAPGSFLEASEYGCRLRGHFGCRLLLRASPEVNSSRLRNANTQDKLSRRLCLECLLILVTRASEIRVGLELPSSCRQFATSPRAKQSPPQNAHSERICRREGKKKEGKGPARI